ncbi:ABC transporter permease subunit [Williamsoniiplasma lucivorax]|uniref:ABC transporter permease n=1 Tax=Williamsoniiplasma lucivorax TaxID=209274 RepID=A0A2S5RFA4_9MOLU|nr:ABC transporter permease subunit [Williamsoniiplasma lucivorax]PPE05815.1 hypothetical protein ELUCI_v1c01030 [Williamsoniiplasma lucivorax]
MKLQGFLPSKIKINTHLKNNWVPILVFGIVWLVITIFIMTITKLTLSHLPITIAPAGQVDNEYKVLSDPISDMLGTFIFGIVGILFFSIVTTTMIYHVINKEMKTGEISLWMTAPLARRQIILSKIVFVWIVDLIILTPSLVFILIWSSQAIDAKQHFGFVILQAVMFISFLFLLPIIFTVICVALVNYGRLSKFINAGIIVYMLATFVMIMLSSTKGQITNPLSWMGNVKYIAIQSLNVNILNFYPLTLQNHYLIEGFRVAKINLSQLPWFISAFFINLILCAGLVYLTIWNFNKKDLAL